MYIIVHAKPQVKYKNNLLQINLHHYMIIEIETKVSSITPMIIKLIQ